MRKMNRLDPLGRMQDYRTFQITSPLSTHWRPASCAESECLAYMNGWRVRVEGLPPDVLHTARTSGRKFTELAVAEGENWLVFEAGQSCFRTTEHRKLLDRQELFIVRDGDHRGNPTGNVRKHTRPQFWVDDMQENQGRLAELHQRG